MTEPCFEFLGAIQQIPIGYLFYILCVNTYIWNQGRWYWRAYLQGSDGNADTENRVKDTGRGEEGEMVRWMQRMSWKLYTSVCKRKALFRVWASWNRHAAGPCVCVKSVGLGDKTLRSESASLVSFLAPQAIKHPWTSVAFFFPEKEFSLNISVATHRRAVQVIGGYGDGLRFVDIFISLEIASSNIFGWKEGDDPQI